MHLNFAHRARLGPQSARPTHAGRARWKSDEELIDEYYGTKEPGAFFETRAINSSNLERNSFRIGDVFALLYPTTRSIVGTSPPKGRLMTDHGRKILCIGRQQSDAAR